MGTLMECKAENVEIYANLTEDERTERARAVTAKLREKGELETDFEQIKEKHKRDLKLVEGEISAMAHEFNAGKANMVVDCTRVFDVDGKTTWLKFRGDEYDHRPMNHAELQACIQPPLIPDENSPKLVMAEAGK